MVCTKCNLLLGPEDFYPSDPNWCKECRLVYQRENRHKYRDRDREYSKQYWKAHKEELTTKQRDKTTERYAMVGELKEASPCMGCGQFFPAVCMDFDHVRGIKVSEISKMVNDKCSWEEILEEVDKCDLVCANCHRLRTQARQKARIESFNDAHD